MCDPKSPNYKDIVTFGVPTPSSPPQSLSFAQQIGVAGAAVIATTYLASRYNGVDQRHSIFSALTVGTAHYFAHNLAAHLEQKDDHFLRDITF
jgi:hypothetical protein